jgi:orotidine-5'-phosphate decarboxylase
MSHNPIIVALDVETADQARTIVGQLGPEVGFYKVGMELYASAGVAFVDELIAEGKQVFLDLKMYDIHEQIKRAVAQVGKRGVRFLTVHASYQVMQAAAEGKGSSNLQILGVTVLTSVDQADLERDGITRPLSEVVELRVRNAMEAGIDGIVCSPLEVTRVREVAGSKAVIVTPGVRSAGAAVGDQKRVQTPRQAMDNGANYLVIGRQVTRATDPRAEVARIKTELA